MIKSSIPSRSASSTTDISVAAVSMITPVCMPQLRMLLSSSMPLSMGMYTSTTAS